MKSGDVIGVIRALSKSRRDFDHPSYEGAGLGLYIAKKYSDLLSATIAVESTEGSGATFTVRIPVDVTAFSASPSS